MNLASLTMKDVSIVDAFPVYNHSHTVLNIGCGDGRIDHHLTRLGYEVYATDLFPYSIPKNECGVKFSRANIFDLDSMPIFSASIVICSQVLEHLPGWKKALINLIALAEVRLIITVPYERSFYDPEHCNFWSDKKSEKYRSIEEFKELCSPYATSICKIRTKPEDVKMCQWGYLIIVDKRQNLNHA